MPFHITKYLCPGLEKRYIIRKSSDISMSAVDLENNQEEWKEIWDNSYLKAIAAFYNTDGGRMIVGRRDDGVFVGLADPKDTAKKISDTIHNKLHINASVRIESFESKECVVVDVRAGKTMVDLDSRFYVRVGNTNQALEGDELKMRLLDEKGLQWLDQPCKATLDDLSIDAFKLFISKGKNSGRIPEDVSDTDMMLALKNMGLMYDDSHLSLTAVLLFANNPDRFNYGAYLKIGLFDSNGRLQRDDILKCPLAMLPDECMRILNEKYIQPTYRYDTGTASRDWDYMYPVEAIRELVVNAIVHMDYSMKQEIAIYVRPDCLEIASPGLLPKGITLDTIKTSHSSIKRNKKLAEAFYAMKYIEGWGQGINNVLNECKANNNPEPEFSYMSFNLLVKLRPKINKLQINPAELVLDDLDRQIIQTISETPLCNTAAIVGKLGKSERTIRYHLNSLRDKGLISREGTKKNGYLALRK